MHSLEKRERRRGEGEANLQQARSEGGKMFGERSVNLRAKRVGFGALIRERSKWDAGEPVDIVFDVPFRPLVISFHGERFSGFITTAR